MECLPSLPNLGSGKNELTKLHKFKKRKFQIIPQIPQELEEEIPIGNLNPSKRSSRSSENFPVPNLRPRELPTNQPERADNSL